jgi:hypothetical protein
MEPISYILTEADVRAGNDLWRRANFKSRQLAGFGLFVWVLYSGVLLLGDPLTPTNLLVATAFGGGVAVLIIGIIPFAARWQSQRLALRYFRASRAAQQETKVSWTETRLRLEQIDSHQDRPWTDTRDWAENEVVLVLLSHGPVFSAFPKRSLSEAQLDDIRTCLARAGVPKAKLFPI